MLVFTSVLYFVLILVLENYKLYYYRYAERKSDVKLDIDPSNQTALETKGLTKVYEKNVKAVNDLSFKLKNRESFALLGPNGAGKSSTFNMITMQIRRTEGEINVLNKPLKDIDFSNSHLGITC